jgi:hypothetical protein
LSIFTNKKRRVEVFINIELKPGAGGSLLESWNGRLRLGRLQIEATLENSSEDPLSKKTRAKCTEGLAQAVEHLLCKWEALSSNPSLPSPK